MSKYKPNTRLFMTFNYCWLLKDSYNFKINQVGWKIYMKKYVQVNGRIGKMIRD